MTTYACYLAHHRVNIIGDIQLCILSTSNCFVSLLRQWIEHRVLTRLALDCLRFLTTETPLLMKPTPLAGPVQLLKFFDRLFGSGVERSLEVRPTVPLLRTNEDRPDTPLDGDTRYRLWVDIQNLSDLFALHPRSRLLEVALLHDLDEFRFAITVHLKKPLLRGEAPVEAPVSPPSLSPQHQAAAFAAFCALSRRCASRPFLRRWRTIHETVASIPLASFSTCFIRSGWILAAKALLGFGIVLDLPIYIPP